jgi:hypothetical protein
MFFCEKNIPVFPRYIHTSSTKKVFEGERQPNEKAITWQMCDFISMPKITDPDEKVRSYLSTEAQKSLEHFPPKNLVWPKKRSYGEFSYVFYI